MSTSPHHNNIVGMLNMWATAWKLKAIKLRTPNKLVHIIQYCRNQKLFTLTCWLALTDPTGGVEYQSFVVLRHP